MANCLKVTHLCVGQGLSVLIELDYEYPVGSSKKFVGLMDLGSIGKRYLCEGACDIIFQAVASNNHELNYVHISHFDEDHYNMFERLRGKSQRDITIKHLVVGGRGEFTNAELKRKLTKAFNGFRVIIPEIIPKNGKYRYKNPYCYVDMAPSTANVNLQIDAQGDEAIFFRINTLVYHADFLSVAASEAKSEHSVRINTGSSIVLVSIVNQDDDPYWSYLFTGDATKYTMRILLDVCKMKFRHEDKHITVSHHGSKRHVADDEEEPFKILDSLLERYPPNQAVVSACCKINKGWIHPEYEIMTHYANAVQDTASAEHSESCFQLDGSAQRVFKILTTQKEIYGTVKMTQAVDGVKYTKELGAVVEHNIVWSYP